MASKLSFLVLVALLTGCGKNVAPALESSSPSPAQEPITSCVQFYSPLPADIELAFPFHLRSDRIFTKKGKLRRRVLIELLEGNAGDAFASASQSLAAAGYQPKGKPKGEPTGRQSQAFTKKGHPSIVLVSNVNVGTKPANPGAVGLMAFDWTPPGAKKAVK